ncbi:hypothetical protein [Rubellimicrobium aerolatum]|uniref:DUF2909 domain-containing protein n=1 Tax=Rubellimicrobium aerolatum TaxID=490979 RepID=A0ABW0SB07_9RHOB|nr:hypothetical protein [Rubellimicrobium aerolatum]MBP1805352.1 hypothetical protein [Rubellimicrobium aerolatum]
MARLILLLMLFAALALAIAAAATAFRALAAPAPAPMTPIREDRMPKAVRTTAYVLLLLLLAGLTSGWLGPV